MLRYGLLLSASLLLAPFLATRLMSNIGMSLVNRGLDSVPETRLAQAQTIFDWIPNDVSSQRGRANIAIVQQDLRLASELWQASGEAQRFVPRGNAIPVAEKPEPSSVTNAMNWYAMALLAGQDSAELWFGIGRLCRMNPGRDALCQQYLARQNDNLLLNPDFTQGLDGWTVKQAPGATYAVVDCADGRCVEIVSRAETPDFAATILQCVAVEAEGLYRFSADISVKEFKQMTAWRPLYAQVFVNGEVREIRSGLPVPEGNGLRVLATEFVMPQTDDGLLCVHLARAEGAAEIVVKNPTLVSVGEAKE